MLMVSASGAFLDSRTTIVLHGKAGRTWRRHPLVRDFYRDGRHHGGPLTAEWELVACGLRRGLLMVSLPHCRVCWWRTQLATTMRVARQIACHSSRSRLSAAEFQRQWAARAARWLRTLGVAAGQIALLPGSGMKQAEQERQAPRQQAEAAQLALAKERQKGELPGYKRCRRVWAPLHGRGCGNDSKPLEMFGVLTRHGIETRASTCMDCHCGGNKVQPCRAWYMRVSCSERLVQV